MLKESRKIFHNSTILGVIHQNWQCKYVGKIFLFTNTKTGLNIVNSSLIKLLWSIQHKLQWRTFIIVIRVDIFLNISARNDHIKSVADVYKYIVNSINKKFLQSITL